MYDFEAIATSLQGLGDGGPLGLASSYELSERWLASLVERGIIAGCVVGDPSALPGVPRIGWWADRGAGNWVLDDGCPKAIALMGARELDRLSGPMLVEAACKGVHTLYLLGLGGETLRRVDVKGELTARLAPPEGMRYGEHGFEQALDLLLAAVGDRLRIPETEPFHPNRVLLVIGSLQPGGAERQLAYTAKGLAASGLDVVVACSFFDPPRDFFRAEVEAAGVRVRLVPAQNPDFSTGDLADVIAAVADYDHLRMVWGLWYEIFHYALLIREERPAVLHAWLDWPNTLTGVASLMTGVPCLVMGGRSVATFHFPGVFQPWMLPAYRAVLARREVLLLNNSAAGARDYERWLGLPEGAIRVLHNGFDFPAPPRPEERQAMRARHAIAPGAVVVGTIARFTEEKQPSLFVETAILLAGRLPQARFIAFGEGPERAPLLERVARLGLDGIILLPGLTTSPWPDLAGMDVFMLTSRMEGLSNVLVEAQAAGLPVVCTGVGGMVETYVEGVTGFGAGNGDAASLARAVEKLIRDERGRRAVGDAGSAHVRREFALDTMVRRTVDLYGAAVSPPSAEASPPPDGGPARLGIRSVMRWVRSLGSSPRRVET